jgi:hypothetical protein
MDENDVPVFVLSLAVAALGWGPWYVRLACLTRLGRQHGTRWVAALGPWVSALLILAVLRSWAAYDVRDSLAYLAFYLVLGLAWLRLGSWVIPLLGVSLVDDLLERRNAAAAVVAVGAWLGLTACYVGGNVGDGPGWWCVAYTAGLATGLWFGLWAVAQWTGGFAERITVDRDAGSGLRLAGLLLALGGVCGRGAAGDWVSFAATRHDMAAATWPALGLVLLAGACERWQARPAAASVAEPAPVRVPALVLALLYLALAAGIIAWAGPLSENPLYGPGIGP